MGFEKLDREVPRVGILGASRIVRNALLAEADGHFVVAAVAARDLLRAKTYAGEHGIARAYGSYADLLADPEIDVVYNALPASGHAPWTLEALRNKKHVLCEKPFGLHVDEARKCVAQAELEGRLLMEAHHWRYHPLAEHFASAVRRLKGGGAPVSIHAQFHAGLNNPGDIRMNPELGPGVLMDFGCYTIQWCVFAGRALNVGAPPQVLYCAVEEGAPGIDMAARGTIRFADEARVSTSFSCDMRDEVSFCAFVRATCGERVVHWENPLGVQNSFVEVRAADGEVTRQEPQGPSTYGGQVRALLHALKTGEPPLTSGENIIETQQLLDDCYRRASVVGRRELRGLSLGAHSS